VFDGDDLDEIVFAQYGNPELLYAINGDGSDVTGFPFDIAEKVQRGVALSDFNNNGKADIVVGTDDEFVHLIYDDGTLAWSYETGGDIRVAPTVLELNTGEKIILIGSKDDNFYGLNSDGTLRFSVETDDDITTEASIVDIEEIGPVIFFDSIAYTILPEAKKITGPISSMSTILASVVISSSVSTVNRSVPSLFKP
jgi:outer membrane protein assembly factor BamB